MIWKWIKFICKPKRNKNIPEIQNLINEINIIKKRSNERYEEIKKKSNEFQIKNVKLTNQLENVQEENRKIADILGKIQMRDSPKNIFMPFEQNLKDEDMIKNKKIEIKNGNWLLKEQKNIIKIIIILINIRHLLKLRISLLN